MNSKRTTVYMDPDVYAWLAETAKRQRRSISSMNNALVDWHRCHNSDLVPADEVEWL